MHGRRPTSSLVVASAGPAPVISRRRPPSSSGPCQFWTRNGPDASQQCWRRSRARGGTWQQRSRALLGLRWRRARGPRRRGTRARSQATRLLLLLLLPPHHQTASVLSGLPCRQMTPLCCITKRGREQERECNAPSLSPGGSSSPARHVRGEGERDPRGRACEARFWR